MEQLEEDRKYYVDVYNKLMDLGELKMLRRLSKTQLKNELDNVANNLKALYRESKLSKQEFNKLIKLVDSYRDI